jgi:hypothetical protein
MFVIIVHVHVHVHKCCINVHTILWMCYHVIICLHVGDVYMPHLGSHVTLHVSKLTSLLCLVFFTSSLLSFSVHTLMFIRSYVYMCTYVHTFICVHTFIRLYAYMRICSYAHMCICLCVYMYLFLYIYMRTCVYVYM